MKNIKKFTKILCCFLVLIISVCFSGCFRSNMLEYYSNDDNYEVYDVVFIRKSVVSDDEHNELIFIEQKTDKVYWLDVLPGIDKILVQNGFYNEVSMGTELKIKYAYEIWGDGYCPPIAAIWNDEKCYLPYEEGKDIIIKHVEETEKF